LPDTIQIRNGNQIVNKYDAGGRKLASLHYTLLYTLPAPLTEGEVLQLYYDMDFVDETGTFHVDNIEYDFNGCDPGWYLLRNVYNTEGYTNKFNVTGGPFYQYYRKDHLGNNREVWCANNATTLQRTHYYPSGLPWNTNTGIGSGVQNRKYNGKEFVEMHGLDEYDSEARWYYPAIMRTTTMDPLAEKYYDICPYAWCGNNPMKFVDPDGKEYELPESGGKPAEEPKINSQSGKIEGQFTAAQSTARVHTNKVPVANIPYTPPLPSPGEILDANKVQMQKFHNFAMSTEINRACLTNPALKSVAVGGLVVTGGVALGSTLPNTTSVKTVSNNIINWANTTAIGVQNATGTSAIGIGIGVGAIQSALPYDAPLLSVNPAVDASSSAIQVLTKLFEISNKKD